MSASLASADLEALRKTLGDEAVATHEPVLVDEVALGATLRPAGGQALAATLALLSERGCPAVVTGGGTRLGLGNPPHAPRVLLSTGGLAGIEELDAEEGVVLAGAGTPLGALRDAAHDAGWELPLDPPGAESTLGGALAAAAVGPRHLGFGRPRDVVLGLTAVHGDGARARCGGRVVKNVTGYDLIKLQLGALGTLGVIESAWLKLRPRPPCERVLTAAVDDGGAAGLAAARLGSARAAAVVDASLAPVVEPMLAPEHGQLLLVELAGDEAAVERDARELGDTVGAEPTRPDALVRLRGLQGGGFGPGGVRVRVSVLPTRVPEALRALGAAGAATFAYPGSGLVFARFSLEPGADGAGADAAWQAARAAALAGSGDVTLEAAPAWAKAGRDVFGDAPQALGLMRALKARFDPAGVLNPGRFAGRL